jgi:hypothetical protein
MRVISDICRNGHPLAGANLLWHTRYDEVGDKFMVRECRTCANARYRAKRHATRRNRQLAEEALVIVREVLHAGWFSGSESEAETEAPLNREG